MRYAPLSLALAHWGCSCCCCCCFCCRWTCASVSKWNSTWRIISAHCGSPQKQNKGRESFATLQQNQSKGVFINQEWKLVSCRRCCCCLCCCCNCLSLQTKHGEQYLSLLRQILSALFARSEEGGGRLLFKAMWQFIYCSTFVQRTNERFPPAADNLPTFGQAINIIINARLDLTHSLPSPSRCRTVHLSQKFDAQKEHYNNNNNKKNIIIVLSPVALSNRGNRPLSPLPFKWNCCLFFFYFSLFLSVSLCLPICFCCYHFNIFNSFGHCGNPSPVAKNEHCDHKLGGICCPAQWQIDATTIENFVEYSKLWTELRKWNFSHGQRWHCPEPELGWGRGIGAYDADQT